MPRMHVGEAIPEMLEGGIVGGGGIELEQGREQGLGLVERGRDVRQQLPPQDLCPGQAVGELAPHRALGGFERALGLGQQRAGGGEPAGLAFQVVHRRADEPGIAGAQRGAQALLAPAQGVDALLQLHPQVLDRGLAGVAVPGLGPLRGRLEIALLVLAHQHRSGLGDHLLQARDIGAALLDHRGRERDLARAVILGDGLGELLRQDGVDIGHGRSW